MKDITCIRCDREPEKRLINGEYWCEQCGKSFTEAEVRANLIEKIKEIERWVQEKKCVTCGRQLNGVWCSWCGKETESGEDFINLVRHRISVIDTVCAEGEPVVFKNARSGDKQAIASIFRETQHYKYGEAIYKSFIGLGAIVVDFLINELKHGQKVEAAIALGEIGDMRAVEPLIDAIVTDDPSEYHDAAEFNRLAVETLDRIGSPEAFTGMLSLLERDYSVQGQLPEDSLQFKIANALNSILERVPAEISENDLIAASELKDISVRLFRFIETGEAEDAYGKYTDGYRSSVKETLDCAFLREAAQREMKRRGLKR